MERDRFSEAKEHFKKAIANGSKNHLAHYHYADALRRRGDGLGSNGGLAPMLSPDEINTIVEELKISIKLMPTFAYSYELLGFVRMSSGDNLEEGEQMLKQAAHLEPQNKQFQLSLAQIQFQRKDYAASKKTLEPLLAAEDDSTVKASAASMMAAIDSQNRLVAEPSTRVEAPS